MYFSKVLIANRGEIAVRIMRACRELGIATVAVASEADRAALHVRQADEVAIIGAAAAAESYLHIERIIVAAQQHGAQAIHPGYGFLAERAAFARACEAAGLVFIGPRPATIELMGAKIAAKRLAESVGVPTAPGYAGDDPQQLRQAAERIGVPLLIKASAGGGGKGMRIVRSMAEFEADLAGARREAQAAFGDNTVFLEKLIVHPRHVEIQVLADQYGSCVHLFERECSIQRRHQKILEESPAPGVTPALRAAMGEAAVRLAQAAGYLNAGTLEFMVDEAGQFYFLEMNTRLQVEHPVTETVTGLDLVQLQIAIAAGQPLPFTQNDLTTRGHAIEARVYAEDPLDYLPSIGTVALFATPEGPGIRNDVGVETGDAVTVYYDPLLAKLIVAAPDRPAAIARLRRALDDYAVLGVTTNLPLLRAISASAAYVAGATTTDFLTENDFSAVVAEPDDVPVEVLAAVALFEMLAPVPHNPWQGGPWRLAGDGMPFRWRYDGQELLALLSRDGDDWRIQHSTTTLRARVVALRLPWLTLAIGDAAATQPLERFAAVRHGSELLVGWRGWSYRLERDAGLSVEQHSGHAGVAQGHAGLEAPMPGTVVKVMVAEGASVAARQPLVVLEAMKMEHTIAAPYAGVVTRLHITAGELVTKGAPLVELRASEG